LSPSNFSNIQVAYLIPQPSQIQGYVTNATHPLSGVDLQSLAVSTGGSQSVSDKSDDDGFYVLPNLGVGLFNIRVTLNGYFPQNLLVNVTRRGLLIRQNFTLVGRTTGSLSGFVNQAVTTTTGTQTIPAVGALVTAVFGAFFNSTITNSEGKYEFPHLVPSNSASYTITASKEGFRNGTVQSQVFLADNVINSPIILTQKSGTLTGSVFGRRANGDTFAIEEAIQICLFAVGKPLPTASGPQSTCDESDAKTSITQGSKGVYTITNVPEGTYQVYAWPSNALLFETTTLSNTVRILEGPAITQDITMRALTKRAIN